MSAVISEYGRVEKFKSPALNVVTSLRRGLDCNDLTANIWSLRRSLDCNDLTGNIWSLRRGGRTWRFDLCVKFYKSKET